MEKIIVGFFLFILGGFMAICTKTMVRFQVWSQRTIMGAQYIPSRRTHTMVRIVGILLVIIGLTILTGILK